MTFDILSIRLWALSQVYLDSIYPTAVRMINNGHDLSRLINQERRADLYPSQEYLENPLVIANPLRGVQSKKGKKFAAINITGGMSKNGDLCSYGMMHNIMHIDKANARDDVHGIILFMDTPGGTVDGTEELGVAIKQSRKPVVVFADQMVASAGYWAASQADHIIANANNDTELGSIGVLYVHINQSKLIDEKIGEVKIIRSQKAVDKARINSIEPLTDELETQIVNELSTIHNKFIKTVKSGRKDKLNTGDEDIFTGKMYSREDALRMGMIDGIGTREDAIEKAAELADGRISISGNSNNSNTNSKNMKWSKISSLFGGNAGEESEDLSPEEKAKLDAAEQKLADQEKQNGDLQEQVKTLNDKIADSDKAHAEAIKTKEAKIAELEGQVKDLNAKLEKAPDGQATTVVSEGDDFEDDPKKVEYTTDTEREAAEYQKVIQESKKFNLN